MGYWEARSLLAWQLEIGVDEAISDSPVDRYALSRKSEPAAAVGSRTTAQAAPPVVSGPDPVEAAREAAKSAADLPALSAAMTAFEHCELKRGARQLVFADGIPGARVMVIGEAPGRDEDREGRPFVGRAGQLLDRMFAAIGLSRAPDETADGIYVTNVLPWRPPQNRDPRPDEVSMMLPFLERHVELAGPEVIVVMGNHACGALLGRTGITRMRGQWSTALGRPVLPMFHPAFLLRSPQYKREAWADLLSLRSRLEGGA